MLFLLAALIFYVAVLAGTVAYALFRGGRDERRAAIILLVLATATQVASVLSPGNGPQYGVMAVDAIGVIALFAVAIRSNGYWPIWATAAQLVGTLTHGVAFVQPTISIELYASTQPFWIFPTLFALAIGTRGIARALRR